MSEAAGLKEIVWIASAKRALKAMPEEVRKEIGYALEIVQGGRTPENAKSMKGNLRDVMEISVDIDAAGTFRATYTTRLGDVVYVLDVFQKKSKRGIATPGIDLDRVAHRLKQARDDYAKTQTK